MDHHTVARLGPTAVVYDEWQLYNALRIKFYNGHGKHRPKLSTYFQIYWYQLNFSMLCATSVLDISWQHLNHPDLKIRCVCWFSFYFQVPITVHHLVTPLSHEDGFSKVKNTYIKCAYYIICDDYDVNADEIWMNGDWFYATPDTNFGDGRKNTQRSLLDNLTWWIITQFKGYMRKILKK